VSGKYADSLIDMQERWSMSDLLDAHDVLDLFEAAEARAMQRHEDALRDQRSRR
jgi:hypothetical protein